MEILYQSLSFCHKDRFFNLTFKLTNIIKVQNEDIKLVFNKNILLLHVLGWMLCEEIPIFENRALTKTVETMVCWLIVFVVLE